MDKKRLRLRGESTPTIYEPGGNGCSYCNGTGYRGRIGVYEIMSISPNIRQVIVNDGGADEIQKVALAEGMTTLRLGAAKLVIQGVTSIAEVERIATE
jgi:type IV pilus assembly protein PilB